MRIFWMKWECWMGCACFFLFWNAPAESWKSFSPNFHSFFYFLTIPYIASSFFTWFSLLFWSCAPKISFKRVLTHLYRSDIIKRNFIHVIIWNEILLLYKFGKAFFIFQQIPTKNFQSKLKAGNFLNLSELKKGTPTKTARGHECTQHLFVIDNFEKFDFN
jgi:hypothetical protein